MNTQERHEEYNTKFFRVYAPIYDYIVFFFAGLRRRIAKKIIGQKNRVLDLACGTGSQSIAFAKSGHSVTGIDLSPDMIKYAKKKIKPNDDIKFILGDASEINFEDSVFDASSISFALSDMPEEIIIKVLKEMQRTTKRGGQIIIVDYYTPVKKFSTKLGHWLVKMFESKYYANFRHVGLEHYLHQVGLKTKTKESYLLNTFQIIECLNEK